jgi:putative lipase involved disintegration of autophagic bodies
MKALGVVAASVIGATVVWQVAFPTYTHRYRLTVSIEIDGQVHTGSSVIEIAYVGQPKLPNVGAFAPAVWLTGHSLGGGLAGLIAPVYMQRADVSDSMAFSLAASRLYLETTAHTNLADSA